MGQEQQLITKWEGSVDWRSRPAIRGHHGGMLASSFVLGMCLPCAAIRDHHGGMHASIQHIISYTK
ncbi:hypothetical protein C1H46_043384 [Malus baccata]|uniref:Uncharacterized protein n=1 Tax=Malus baccata TaxID=106549 RepID=A0A540KA22_MALBA|nr:hypothetical protein C1H46_043384 [Malus baccata]